MKKTKKKLYKQAKNRYLDKRIGVKNNPTLYVFRSNKQIYVQLIDHSSGHTLASFSTLEILEDMKTFYNVLRKYKTYFVGRIIANFLVELDITKIIYDRGDKSYKGLIKILFQGLINYKLEL